MSARAWIASLFRPRTRCALRIVLEAPEFRDRPTEALRDLVDEAVFKIDPARALEDALLLDAALVIVRARQEHRVFELGFRELRALARARERVAHEHAMLQAFALLDPAKAAAPLDGGRALRRQTLALALAAARK